MYTHPKTLQKMCSGGGRFYQGGQAQPLSWGWNGAPPNPFSSIQMPPGGIGYGAYWNGATGSVVHEMRSKSKGYTVERTIGNCDGSSDLGALLGRQEDNGSL